MFIQYKNYQMNKQSEAYTPSAYSHLANAYNRNQFESILKLLKNLAYQTTYNQKYPILKLLKAVSRRLLINQFESIFFAYVVQTNKWNIYDQIILNYCQEVRDIVCYSTEQKQYKAIILYLLLCGYTVKYYLNENIDIYINQLEKICPDFKSIFEQWAKQYALTTLKINPKNLNKVFKSIYLETESKNVQSDYNSLVDNLLQISPSYNPQKQKNKTTDKPNIQKKSVNHQHSNQKLSNSITIPPPMMSLFNNSNFFNQINPILSSGFFNNNSSLVLKKKRVSLGNSGYGIDNIDPVEDEILDIHEVTLDIGKVVQSDSEDNVEPKIKKLIKKQDGKQEGKQQQGQIAFNRIVSNTSDYINMN